MTQLGPANAADLERDRVAALVDYDVLNGPAVAELVGLVELAAQLSQTGCAVINLLDDRYQHQLAPVGFDAVRSDRADSLCRPEQPADCAVVVPDARLDSRFSSNPWVTGKLGTIRFYAATPLLTPSGQLIGVLSVFDSRPGRLSVGQFKALRTLAAAVMDALELRRRSRQLTETVSQLAGAQRQLAELAGQLSHDLKTPLTASLGFGELLQEHPVVQADPVVRGFADRSVSASRRMMQAIEKLLSQATFEGTPDPVPVPVADLVADVWAELTGSVEDSSLCESQLRCDGGSVVADPAQLRSLLLALIENSLRYRRPERPCEVVVTVASSTSGSELRVIDNGHGIAAGRRRDLLLPPGGKRPNSVGTGLPSCARIAAAHGGTLSISDTAGGGTTVCVSLPLVG